MRILLSIHSYKINNDINFLLFSLNFVSFCFILFYFFCYFQLMDWLFNHLSKGKIGNKGGCGAGRNSISDLNLFENTSTLFKTLGWISHFYIFCEGNYYLWKVADIKFSFALSFVPFSFGLLFTFIFFYLPTSFTRNLNVDTILGF